MKLRSMKVQEEPKLMIIPMIDIIFFLLVFFMISTMTMVQQNTFNLLEILCFKEALAYLIINSWAFFLSENSKLCIIIRTFL